MKNEITNQEDFLYKIKINKQEFTLKLENVLEFVDKSARSLLTSMNENEEANI